MKRLLTAALCQLAAAARSSKCKLRTSTINKGIGEREREYISGCVFVYTIGYTLYGKSYEQNVEVQRY